MAKQKFSDRIDKVDERTISLVKKYPLVAATVYLVGLLCGVLIGWAVWH